MKKLNLKAIKLYGGTVFVTENVTTKLEAVNLDEVVDVDLVSFDTEDNEMHAMYFICENRKIAAYIIRLMRHDVKESTTKMLQDTELSRLLDAEEVYNNVINWKASNGIFITPHNEESVKYFKLPVGINEYLG